MRINKVEIKNLNSVKGEWTIDFTDESYAENYNQFVICGDTGAGKTTILDAITLALYGKTPRLSVGKNENELMCKGQADCMAAVTYECAKGVFRSVFYQKRARMNPKRNLQDAECSIENVETGENLDNVKSITSLAKATKGILNLDYDQFCRSILLAQGSFDQFIKGSESEKADILAKLNGTEHYKKFAQYLWDDVNEQIKQYKEKGAEIEKIEVLSDSEIEALDVEQKQLDAELIELDETNAKVQKQFEWKKELVKCETAFETAKAAQEEFNKTKSNFDQARLDAANRAQKCEVQYVTYMNLDQECKTKKEEKQKAENENQKRTVELAHAQEKETLAQQEFVEFSSKKAENNDLWKRVVELDRTITTLNEQCKEQMVRRAEAEEKYLENQKICNEGKASIEKNQAEICTLEAYLESHKADVQLAELIPGLKENQKTLSAHESKVKNVIGHVNEVTIQVHERRTLLQRIQTELGELDAQLKQFVSSNYKSISDALRATSLEDGKACPVCGSVDHPFCKNHGDEASLVEEQDVLSTSVEHESANGVTAKIVELSNHMDEKQSEESECRQRLIELEADLKNTRDNLDSEQAELLGIVAAINEQIAAWNMQLDESHYGHSMSEILEKLGRLSQTYTDQSDRRSKLVTENEKLQAMMEQVDLVELKKVFDKEDANTKKLQEEVSEKNKIRIELFADKDVEEEEAKYNRTLKEKEDMLSIAKETLNEAEKQLSISKSSLDKINQDLLLKNTDLESANNALENLVSSNGFNDIAAFEEARMDEMQREALNAQKEALSGQEIELHTKLVEAEQNLNKQKSIALTEATLQELELRLAEIRDSVKDKSSRKGQIGERLTANQKQIEKREELRADYEQSLEQMMICEEIKAMIGKKDGSEFEIFVQKMAMKNLLVCANGYLEQILNDYSLVQKENSMELLLHDINYNDPEDDRPISNLSGGERFAVSLSLALGIAEVASHKMQVDSLFLDEGFGTLSGEPLMDAINALKLLRNTGKTLGIITHVDTVIGEFDQKIHAQKRNGFSVFDGAGIRQGFDQP